MVRSSPGLDLVVLAYCSGVAAMGRPLAELGYSSFVFSDAPLSDVSAPLTAAAAYILVVLVLHWSMAGRSVETKRLQAVHNMVLCLWSLVMFVGTLYELLVRAGVEAARPDNGNLGGMRWFFCERHETSASGPLFFWSYIYYLSKYYELFDTVLQLLKGRPPPHFFLHVYHHAAVLLMAWAWLEYRQTLQFGGLLFNTAVHVVMYYYYFRRVLGLSTPWKRFVTQFQIIQFGTSLVCFLATLKLILIDGADCSGTRAMAFNLVFNVTLLWQFVGVLTKGAKSQ